MNCPGATRKVDHDRFRVIGTAFIAHGELTIVLRDARVHYATVGPEDEEVHKLCRRDRQPIDTTAGAENTLINIQRTIGIPVDECDPATLPGNRLAGVSVRAGTNGDS